MPFTSGMHDYRRLSGFDGEKTAFVGEKDSAQLDTPATKNLLDRLELIL